jgi:hypothetical protein
MRMTMTTITVMQLSITAAEHTITAGVYTGAAGGIYWCRSIGESMRKRMHAARPY